MMNCSPRFQKFGSDSWSFQLEYANIATYKRQNLTFEPHREKTGFLPMQKQRRRSASQ